MMIFPDINEVYLTGRLAEDPQRRTILEGLQVTNAKLIVGSRILSTQKEQKFCTLNLVCYGLPIADIVSRLVANDKVFVKGEIRTRSTAKKTDDNNADDKNPDDKKAYSRTTTEIVIRTITRCADIDVDGEIIPAAASVPAQTALTPNDPSSNNNPKAWSR